MRRKRAGYKGKTRTLRERERDKKRVEKSVGEERG